ncbi:MULTISPECIES: hypothetical protein [unclassified Mesorhizobium]|uniref:hypothetical protein n=1 Tax=unclassified Mesorhizobium TaxID=325217 RepID=UPI0011278075|nr:MULTISPECIES: hypothetical protein [unclassified Mesorhizobium]TPJ47243.1 hypothetical protein FJ437_10090 [Mesorhizobium sp. B2-6-6]MBZ9999643.1 hypothetical protein [Mesorhizobium sp. B264B2A]MCA0008117.1 hypothetical protein [Mesorhizobium sp. B264B1B]MCA0018009.1 hypothetical protein [Mesorhizobium sp. B264B1A]TPJ56752.1 hypothetical protein FJ462_32545 [Mesorhizobium sp. B2-6-7]
MADWQNRDFTVAEAAALAGLRRGTLDAWVHRIRDCEILFSERRGDRRWFSPQDICILRVGYELERAGRGWLTAIAQAFEHLQTPPAADDVLVVDVMSVSSASGRVISDRDVERLAVDKSKILLPIGSICAEISERCAAIYGGTDVAVS